MSTVEEKSMREYKITLENKYANIADKLFQLITPALSQDIILLEAKPKRGVVKATDYGYTILRLAFNKNRYGIEAL